MFDVGKLTIPLFVGTVLNWALFGALAVQVCDSRDTIVTFGAGWGDPDSLDRVGWAWLSVPILGSTIASVGQIFFAWRISIIGDTLYIPALIVAITTVQYGAGIWTGVDIIRAGRFSLLKFDNLKPPVNLLHHRQLSVETGVLCALFAIVDLSLYVAFDGNNYHLATCIWLSKVYSNSMMVVSVSLFF
ncbi:hypothetical protein MVEN_01855800 [Mycena venus]|uniref:Uncharacterized protein n=1 Tax=Mycena venus TaxID=2733690 RepID=A0A8H6XIC7_9AGAR|nr:hypothetical protein MVEN_01855800 [Mycena venus]